MPLLSDYTLYTSSLLLTDVGLLPGFATANNATTDVLVTACNSACNKTVGIAKESAYIFNFTM